MSYEFMNSINKYNAIGDSYNKNLSQRLVDSTFDMATNTFFVEAQIGNTDKYEQLEVIMDSAISKSNLQTNLYDVSSYKKIIFRNISYKPKLGQYFRFDEFTWMCMETSHNNTTSKCLMQRCNNKLYSLDNDNLIETYCCIKDVTQQGTGLQYKEDFSSQGSLGALIVPVNDITLKYHIDQRMHLLGRYYKVAKVDTENTLLDYDIQEGILVIKLQEDYKNTNTDSDFMADRYKYTNRPDIKFIYEKTLSYNLNETFTIPMAITKDGQPYTMIPVKYDLTKCEFITNIDNTFKINDYGIGKLKIYFHENNFDEIIEIDINCVNEIGITPTYKIINIDQSFDDFNLKYNVEKTYSCKKYIGDNLVNDEFEVSYIVNNIVDISKIIINTSVKDEIDIFNREKSIITGNIEISFKDKSNDIVTSKIITFKK